MGEWKRRTAAGEEQKQSKCKGLGGLLRFPVVAGLGSDTVGGWRASG